MPDTDTAVETPPAQEAPREETLADRISKRVEDLNRKRASAEAPPQDAPPAAEAPPVETPAEPAAKPNKRVSRRTATEDAILPPESLTNKPDAPPVPDETERQIDEGLKKGDKTEGIQHLRSAYEGSKQKISDLENQLKQLRDAPKAPEDYETLKKQVTEYSTELEKVALERHPEFRRKFGDQISTLDAAAKKLVGGLTSQVTPEEFTALLAAPSSDAKTSRINELIEGATPLVASKVANLVTNYETLQDQKSAMLSQHSETLKQLDMQQRASAQERMEREQRGFEQIVGDLSQEYEYLKPVEGNPAWNEVVNKIKGQAREIYFSSKDPVTLMQASLKAPMADYYRKAYHLAWNKAQELEGRLAEIEKAAPNFDSGKGGGSSAGASGSWDDKKSYAENMASRIAERGGMSARAGQ
jgi:DNA repair exonuclease SbcCD ATPase subunit